MTGTRYIVTVDPGCTVEVVSRLPKQADAPASGFSMVFLPDIGKFNLVSTSPEADAAWLRLMGWTKSPCRTDPYGEYWQLAR